MNPNDPGTSPGTPELQTKATDDLGQVTDRAKHDLDAVAEKAKADVKDIGQQASAKVSEAAESAKSFAGDQKNLAADQVNGVASAINKVADELDGSDQQMIGRYARDLASGISNVGKMIENNDVDDLMGMAQDFGRKQPVAFLGAAALVGFMASRFALASSHRREQRPGTNTGYQGGSNATSPNTYSNAGTYGGSSPSTGSGSYRSETSSSSGYGSSSTSSASGSAATGSNTYGSGSSSYNPGGQ